MNRSNRNHSPGSSVGSCFCPRTSIERVRALCSATVSCCLLTQLGRTSGRRYQTVVEAGKALEIQVGRTAYPPVWRIVGLDEARWTLREYLYKNRRGGPIIRSVLGGMLGWPFDGSDAALNRAIEQLQLVGVRPR